MLDFDWLDCEVLELRTGAVRGCVHGPMESPAGGDCGGNRDLQRKPGGWLSQKE